MTPNVVAMLGFGSLSMDCLAQTLDPCIYGLQNLDITLLSRIEGTKVVFSAPERGRAVEHTCIYSYRLVDNLSDWPVWVSNVSRCGHLALQPLNHLIMRPLNHRND